MCKVIYLECGKAPACSFDDAGTDLIDMFDYGVAAPYSYDTSESLTETTETTETIETTKPFDCMECSEKFKSHSLLRRHFTRAHPSNQLISCTECVQMFTDYSSLARHLETHFAEETLKCPECALRFMNLDDLENHKHVHKPFACPECPLRFKWQSSLTYHQKNHSTERPFKCPLCPKKFKQLKNLQRHDLVHSGFKPFGCLFCDKKYQTNFALRKHMRFHPPTSLFGSEMLNARIGDPSRNRPNNLNLGPQNVSTINYQTPTPAVASNTLSNDVRTFPCSECDETFRRRADWLRHFRIHRSDWKPPLDRSSTLSPDVRPNNGSNTIEDESDGSSESQEQSDEAQAIFTCGECREKFDKRGALMRHLLRHLGR